MLAHVMVRYACLLQLLCPHVGMYSNETLQFCNRQIYLTRMQQVLQRTDPVTADTSQL